MITKNNIIIFCVILIVIFICYFLQGQITSDDVLASPMNSRQQNQQDSSIYIDC